jgi:hypothetical protein
MDEGEVMEQARRMALEPIESLLRSQERRRLIGRDNSGLEDVFFIIVGPAHAHHRMVASWLLSGML